MKFIYLECPLQLQLNDRKLSMSLNTFLGNNKYFWYTAKKEYEVRIIFPQILSGQNRKVRGIKRYRLVSQFEFTNRRVKDPSNYIAIIHKVVLDSLVKHNVLTDDNLSYHVADEMLPHIFGVKRSVLKINVIDVDSESSS